MEKLPKIFVLDTNVILHDHRSIYNFQENDLVIPVAVLEELDKFKKGNDTINFNAREFVRNIDEISDPRLFNGHGFPLGKGRGTLTISLNRPFPKDLAGAFKDDLQDHRILATSIWYKNTYPNRIVGLVTKDVNLRMKAKALGMLAQDYLTDHIKEERISENQKRIITVKGLEKKYLDAIINNPYGVSIDEIRYTRPACNQLYRFKGELGEPVLARYNERTKSIVSVTAQVAYGILPRNDEQKFALDAIMNPDIKLISLTGTAGTGKTLLALAGALAQANIYDQIMLARPVIPLTNQEIGFLPGDAKEKIGPYMLPLYDNLSVIKKNFKESSKENVQIEDMLRREKLIISPLAYIRGRSLSNVFFIIDEAQNLTPHEVKTIITRAGEGTKIVFTGDIQQIDQPYLDKWSNGLTHLSDKLYGEELFEHVNLLKGERSLLSELAGKKL
ncbi:MAG: PhoH family protein [Bacteroidales bacterium]